MNDLLPQIFHGIFFQSDSFFRAYPGGKNLWIGNRNVFDKKILYERSYVYRMVVNKKSYPHKSHLKSL